MVERVYFLILVDGGFFFLFLFFVCLTCLYSGIRFCTHLMFIIEKKKKKLLSRLLLSSFGFPNSGITVTESFQEMGPTVQSSFPVTGSRLVSFCHS